MNLKKVVAIDLGASSGRVMSVGWDGARLTLAEQHRFANEPVRANGWLYWDALRLWHEIQAGIRTVEGAASLGVDSWGVDFALLDRNGDLVANPVHYRDLHKEGAMDWAFARVPRREIFERTGLQFLSINGLFHLCALVRDASPMLESAHTLLTIADLFNYWLSGSKTCEFTEASTLQMMNPRTGDWDKDLLTRLGLPTHFLPPLVPPGTRLGHYQGIPVVASACHDTGSAVVAVPFSHSDAAYLSSGTWSLIGVEIREALITEAVYQANLTNEGGAEGTFRLLKNVAGMWLVQQCQETWAAAGRVYSFAQMVELAQSAPPFVSFIDVDAPDFLPAGDMPRWIQAFCERTGQPIPSDEAAILRTIYESLALKYRYVFRFLESVTGRHIPALHVIGGGSQNALLCQMTADALGREVIAGPSEATALGNGVMQLIALGELADVAQARAVISASFPTTRYLPQNGAEWDAAYRRFEAILEQ
jgi:sugar (pentulose or hexulose) kinase